LLVNRLQRAIGYQHFGSKSEASTWISAEAPPNPEKLAGLMVEKVEVGGPGVFDDSYSVDGIRG
jgi:hypothetical protein